MIVVVTGSRSFDTIYVGLSRLTLKQEFLDAVRSFNPDHVFHGGASGPDSWAEQEFSELTTVFEPNFKPSINPRQALFARNLFMVNTAIREDSDVQVVACWDGYSNGTKHAMNYAREMDVPVLSVTGEVPWNE